MILDSSDQFVILDPGGRFLNLGPCVRFVILDTGGRFVILNPSNRFVVLDINDRFVILYPSGQICDFGHSNGRFVSLNSGGWFVI